MKTIKYLIAAVIVSTALFTGCKKEDRNDSLTAYEAKKMGPRANITYRLQTIPQRPGYMLQWNSGSVITTNIVFNGSIINGDVGELMSFDSPGLKTIDLTKASLTTLGSVNVAYNKYLRGNFAVEIDPVNSMTSLILNGYFYPIPPPTGAIPFSPVPIEIAVSTHAVLNSVQLANLYIDKSNYIATISLDINQLTHGLTQAMLNGAALTDGTLLISNESNPLLYGIIVKNMENYMLNLQFSAQLMNTANPVQ